MPRHGIDKFKVAVLGTGSIGMRHLAVLRGLNVEPLVMPIRAERKEYLKEEGWITVSTFDEAREKGAAGVVVATDTSRHVSDIKAALASGLDVLCEKPLSISRDEALDLPRISKKAGKSVHVAQCLRFDAGLWQFRGMLELMTGVHSIRIESRSYLPDWRPQRDYRLSYSARAAEGGVLRDMIHEVDYALWIAGSPRTISGTLKNTGVLGIESEELAEAFWNSPSGAVVSMELDYISRYPARFVRACGHGGELEYNFITRNISRRLTGEAPVELMVAGTPADMYVEQMREFLSLLDGHPAGRLCPLSEALDAIAVCDAWRRSSLYNRHEEVARWV